MQVISDELNELINRKLFQYFDRKAIKPNRGFTYAEADKLISNAGSTASAPHDMTGAIDLTKPCVQGGGRTRTTDEEAERIIAKHEAEQDPWDALFDTLLQEASPKEKRLISLRWKQNKTNAEISSALHINKRTLQQQRSKIICRAALIAVSLGLIEP